MRELQRLLAVDEFKALRRHAGRSPWVFPDSTGKNHFDPKLITRSIARCEKRLKALGVEKFTGHDLRRTGRTNLARLKIEPHIAERCLNHAAGSVIERTLTTYMIISMNGARLSINGLPIWLHSDRE